MGSKYTVQVWGKHWGEQYGNFNMVRHAGKHLLPALWALWKARRQGYGCVTLEVRG